mmetsp:Transcript_19296/g.38936  ORF Transcript_19296/g.38936 Transcript_19296/m.38936 type:complete len:149 (+) Transcript_19296:164-610(+)
MVLVSSPSESSVPLVLRGSATSSATSTSASSGDPLLDRLRTEANEVISSNPALLPLLDNFVLSPKVDTFEDAIANIVAHRLTVFSPAAFPCMVKINGNGNGNGGSSSSSGGGSSREYVIHQSALLGGLDDQYFSFMPSSFHQLRPTTT